MSAADPGGTDEIRGAAASWTMAHDKMLLGHLSRFGDSLDRRTAEMKQKLSALRDDTKRAEDALGLLNNEFMVLANEVRRCAFNVCLCLVVGFKFTYKLKMFSPAIHRGQSLRR